MANLNDDVLAKIHLRNMFYQRKYYFALGVYFLSIVTIIILGFILYYLVQRPTEPLYFVADRAGRLTVDTPLNVPNMPTEDVIAWVSEAVQAAYSYDFINYPEQLQSAQKYFTDYGWREYMNGLRASNNLLALSKRKLVITAKIAGRPKLATEGILAGAYAWKFQIPMLLDYLYPPYDDKSYFQNPLQLTVVVQRQKMLTSYQGLGIVQMIGTLVSTPLPPNLTTQPMA
jgi:intracellular multiplication protein IcmL